MTSTSRVIDRLRIGRFWMARPWRNVRTGWSQLPSSIHRLALIPNDLFIADPSLVREIDEGLFGLVGRTVHIGRGSPFSVVEADPQWLAELHRFTWLGHLRADRRLQTVVIARRWVIDWIGRNRRARGPAWRPGILATRITAWLVNAGFLLDEADPAFYRAVLRSLGAQIRRLDAMRHDAAPGLEKLGCLVALVQAALAIDAGERHLLRLEGELAAELERQIDADGCHVGRNPADALAVLLLVLPLRSFYLAIGREPRILGGPIDRMFGFVHHIRLGDGTLARFNGMGESRRDLLGLVLPLDRSAAGPTRSSSAGAYARLERAGTVVIVDVGTAPPLAYAAAAHAGCLSFEMSSGSQCLLRNCGAPSSGAGDRAYVARSTASHNTLALDARSSSQLVASPALERLLGAKPLRGPGQVTAVVGEDDTGSTLSARHDGYAAETGVVHERRLMLSNDGRRLEGTDTLGGRSGVLRLPVDLPFAIHFHLAADLAVRVEPDGQAALINLPGEAPGWRFAAVGARVFLESSTDWADVSGPVRGRQIVLRGVCPGEVEVSWSMQALDEPDPGSTRD